MIVENENKILMGIRGNVFGKGSWALPGGHLEINEKVVDCVIRELDEEVGIIPGKLQLLGVVNDVADKEGQTNHYVRFVYKIMTFTGNITNKEPDKCLGWEWVDKNKIPEPVFVGHIKVIKLYLNDIGFFLE